MIRVLLPFRPDEESSRDSADGRGRRRSLPLLVSPGQAISCRRRCFGGRCSSGG